MIRPVFDLPQTSSPLWAVERCGASRVWRCLRCGWTRQLTSREQQSPAAIHDLAYRLSGHLNLECKQ